MDEIFDPNTRCPDCGGIGGPCADDGEEGIVSCLRAQLAEVTAQRDAALEAAGRYRSAIQATLSHDLDCEKCRRYVAADRRRCDLGKQLRAEANEAARDVDRLIALAQQPATNPGPNLVEQYSSGRRPCGCDTTCIGGSNIDSDRVCRAAKVNSGPGAPTIAEVADEIRALVPGGWQVSRAEEEERAEAERAVIAAAREAVRVYALACTNPRDEYKPMRDLKAALAALDAKEADRG